MAATPTVEDSATAADNWPQDDQALGPGSNEQPANGASSAVEERSAGQDPEPQDYPRGSSADAVETFREKQVKVLRSFQSVFACHSELLPPLVWHSHAGLHLSSSVS
jgi:hypothetical protein